MMHHVLLLENEDRMTDFTHMEIGGLHFAISSKISDTLQQPEPAYRSFLGKVKNHPGRRPADILIRLQLGGMPDTENLQKIFDSGQSWSMFQDRDDYCLTLNPPAFKQPFWLARINRDFTEATVYCSEKLVSRRNGRTELSNPVSYPLDQILLMYILARRQGALLHAAGIDINGRGYIFPGKSGAGKSTITRQFAALGDTGLLSDDRIVVRKLEGTFKAYGTPWPGEAGIALNESVPLASIFFINHGSANLIKDITPQEALARLLPVTSIPWYDREVMDKILTFCEDLISSVPIYELDFKPSVEVVDVFERFVSTHT
jgi:hypothetical protein